MNTVWFKLLFTILNISSGLFFFWLMTDKLHWIEPTNYIVFWLCLISTNAAIDRIFK